MVSDGIKSAAGSPLPVLIYGETGTGKELAARLVHDFGHSSETPFVIVDCATLSRTLAEAELFGAARGAFSGAVSDRNGLVAAADGGTLFLDELASLGDELQAMLLRLVQFGTYRRVGEAVQRCLAPRQTGQSFDGFGTPVFAARAC